MNKFYVVFGFLVLAGISFFALKICPPRGPWPAPPWCVYETPFTPRTLSYLEPLPEVNKSLVFGVGTMDVWGNPHMWLDLGDVPYNYIKPTMERIRDIGASLFLLTDFVVLSPQGDLLITTKKTTPFGYTISEDEMKTVVNEAKKNELRTFILVNLADTENEIGNFLKSVKKEGNVKETLVATAYQSIVNKTVGLSSAKMLQNYTLSDWDELFSKWEYVILKEAEKAESAGVNGLIISPGDVAFEYYTPKKYQQEKYEELASKVREKFHGKVGIMFLSQKNAFNVSFLDFEIYAPGIEGDSVFKQQFSNVSLDTPSLEKAWKNVIKGFPKSTTLYLSVTLPSYTGAIHKGWIEPGGRYPNLTVDFKEQALGYDALFRELASCDCGLDGVISYGYWWNSRLYPETRVLRNDLSHSIRNKDAETVFYLWARAFSA